MSSMLQARRSSTAYGATELLAIGMSCFGPVWVNGRSLVPAPPWRTMPFTASHPTLNLPLGIVAYDNCEPDRPLPTFRRDLRRDLRMPLLGPDMGALQYLSNLGIVDPVGAGLDEETQSQLFRYSPALGCP